MDYNHMNHTGNGTANNSTNDTNNTNNTTGYTPNGESHPYVEAGQTTAYSNGNGAYGNTTPGYGTQNGYYQSAPYQQMNGYGQQTNYQQANPYMQPTGQEPVKKPKKAKKQKNTEGKKGNFGVTLAKGAAVAVVFGLVAGGVFTGVSYGGRQLWKNDVSQTQEQQQEKTDEKNNSTAENSSTTDSSSYVEQTATGNAKELTDVSSIIEEVMPSIVAITNTGSVTYESFWGQSYSYPTESCGSGIIIAEDDQYLYVTTNNHVVAGADALTVQFFDDTTVSCEVQGTDASDDLAVVRVVIDSIEPDTLSQIKIASVADTEQLKVGEPTIAIGNALGYGQSVTTGVISALGRTVSTTDSTTGTTITNTNLIQTDAAINPGNSGGALLNAQGEVIGINSVKYSSTSVEGIGYAIPMSDAMEIIQQLIDTGTVKSSQSAYLGIQGNTVSSDVASAYGIPEGVYIYQVIEGSGAEEAGLHQGDIITALDGQSVTTMESLKSILENYSAGDTITLTVARVQQNGYQEEQVSVTLSSSSLVTQ